MSKEYFYVQDGIGKHCPVIIEGRRSALDAATRGIDLNTFEKTAATDFLEGKLERVTLHKIKIEKVILKFNE
jgi:hypothetical protein